MDTLIAIIASFTALTAVVLSPLVSIYIAKKQINAQVVSGNRQIWINRLRDELASFIRDVRHISSAHSANAVTTSEAIQRYEELILKEETIKLLLNPNETEHSELLRLIASAREKTLKAINTKLGMAKEQKEVADLIIAAAQPLLKNEWNRVKRGE